MPYLDPILLAATAPLSDTAQAAALLFAGLLLGVLLIGANLILAWALHLANRFMPHGQPPDRLSKATAIHNWIAHVLTLLFLLIVTVYWMISTFAPKPDSPRAGRLPRPPTTAQPAPRR